MDPWPAVFVLPEDTSKKPTFQSASRAIDKDSTIPVSLILKKMFHQLTTANNNFD